MKKKYLLIIPIILLSWMFLPAQDKVFTASAPDVVQA